MEKFEIENDIRTICLRAESFPDGVEAAHREIHTKAASAGERRCFGISYPEEPGKIIYRAGLEESYEGEAEELGLEAFVIRKGGYISEFIPDFMADIPKIGLTFQKLLDFEGIDPNGYCLEIYEGDSDVRCLVPLDPSYKGEIKMTNDKNPITIETIVDAQMDKVWETWTGADHIKKWNSPSDDWHTTAAENDLRTGGKFSFRMEAKDGSFGFDFGGTYTTVGKNERIDYTLDDNRKVSVIFEPSDAGIKITETFEPEDQNPLEMQKSGWQAILDNFKKYAENIQEN
ncbi:MAG: SRPBCC family protein [Pyrinomonadaceae bacterium]